MPFRIFSTSVKRRTTAKFADANTNDGKQVAASFHAPKKYVAPCGSCRFRLHALSETFDFRKTEFLGKNLLAQIDERRQQVAASFRAPKKCVAPCGSCRFPYVTDRKAEVRAMGAYGKNLLAQIDERRQASCRVVPLRGIQKNTAPHKVVLYFFGSPMRNRTADSAVRGQRLNRLTMRPFFIVI